MSKTNKHKPMFSIIVPVYNVQKYLTKCINSIISQTYSNYELILVNDGSTDNSLKICKEFASSNSKIKIINKENQGLVSARNSGLKIATGEFVTYVDGDDWISEDYLDEIVKVICRFPNIDLVTFQYYKIFNSYKDKSKFHFEITKKPIKEGYYNKNDFNKLLLSYIFTIGNYDLNSCRNVYRRKLLLRHYCKDNSIIRGEDYAYTYEYLMYANEIYFLNKYLYYYNNTNTTSITKSNIYNPSQILRLYKYIFSNISNINSVIDKQLYMSIIYDCFSYYAALFKRNKKLESPKFKDFSIFNKLRFMIFIKNSKKDLSAIIKFCKQTFEINKKWGKLYYWTFNLFIRGKLFASRLLLEIIRRREA